MINTFDEIIRAALTLPPDARAMLAEHLLSSLDAPDQAIVDAAWAEVVEQRLQDVQQGNVSPIPADQVFQELRNRHV
ncbi:addiction module protein [Stenomitos frigidus]|uniref:Addiction module protein n=1 Tax=Stenomitos frigidus ULC18 TaxID=2107698 RepID=A0A2T1DUJ1_9CYAN|nr:addiction module protein [Stenomitos frigidus]PSB24173.1 addiction module protein [Stenomitos frigidus ULC18]